MSERISDLRMAKTNDLFAGATPEAPRRSGAREAARALPRAAAQAEASYTAADIEVLEGLEPVRRRPACISAAPTRRACTISSPR